MPATAAENLRERACLFAGIFTWFIGLAFLMIALKAAGHQITWAFQFTNPLFRRRDERGRARLRA